MTRYDKIKALYDNAGTPGEKAAALAAMKRIGKPKIEKKFITDINEFMDFLNEHNDINKLSSS